MKILKAGELPNPLRWGKCNHCGCMIECSVNEAKLVNYIREGDFYFVVCPTPGCGETIWVTEDRLYPHSEEG